MAENFYFFDCLLDGERFNLPQRILLYFFKVVAHSIVTTGSWRIVADQLPVAVREGSVLHDEPSSAVATFDWHKLFLDALEQTQNTEKFSAM